MKVVMHGLHSSILLRRYISFLRLKNHYINSSFEILEKVEFERKLAGKLLQTVGFEQPSQLRWKG